MTLLSYEVLFDCLLACAHNLEALHVAVATDGTTTTLADTQLPVLGYDQDDLFNGGTIFFLVDAAADTNAVDKTRYISDYAQSTGTITFTPAMPFAVAAGDKYGVMTGRYPLYVMTEKVNKVLWEQDVLVTKSIAANGSREYILPSTAAPTLDRGKRIYDVRIGSTAADVEDWYQALMWRYDVVANKLIFKDDIPTGDEINVRFWTRHLRLDIDTGALDADLNADWIGMAAAVECARWHLSQPGADERATTALLNDLMVRLQTMRRHYGWRPNAVTHIYGTFWPEG